MMDRVTLEVSDGVADVRLNRPDKLNALDPAMFEALSRVGEQLRKDRTVRAVVLSGSGRAFSAGLDFQAFAQIAANAEGGGLFEQALEGPENRAQHVAFVWQRLPVPVIAAVHGYAYGGGLQIALGADIRIVSPDARLSVMEIRWGLVPDMSGTQTLRRLVRLDVAKELTFTGRIFDGSEAKALGLATRVEEDPLSASLELASEISKKSPEAIIAAKKLLNASGLVSIEEGLALEAKLQQGLVGSNNQIEAVMANMEKRAPRFADPETLE